MKLKDPVNVLKKSAYVNYSFPGLRSSHCWNCRDAARNAGGAGTQERGRGWRWEAGEERMEEKETQTFLSTREDLGDIWSSSQRQWRPGKVKTRRD